MKEIIIQVLNVQRVTDIATGDIVVQITMGTPIPMNSEIQARLPTERDESLPSESFTNLIQMMLPFEEAGKYIVGSKWILTTNADGNISITLGIK
ncbi:MAG: hypothetical protein ACYCUZ_05260 [Cuniculiplasma sp.]